MTSIESIECDIKKTEPVCACAEGEATAHYVGGLLRARALKVTRIARGSRVGGELEHVDSRPWRRRCWSGGMFRSLRCHCEEFNDEAISIFTPPKTRLLRRKSAPRNDN